jgi:hypothetical protein
MRILMQEGMSPSELQKSHWRLGLTGTAVDDRGEAAVRFVEENTEETRNLTYAPDQFTISVGSKTSAAEELQDIFAGDASKDIILEATTLGFVEIFLCTRALRMLKCPKLSLLYVEPNEYTSPRRSQLVHRRDFDLSDEVPGFKGIPGATLITTNRTRQRAVFFLGYEERRLDVALQTLSILPTDTIVVFGVPAFTPGWEMNSFANNIRVIRDNNISGGVQFCGAENPNAAFEVLADLYQSLLPGERLIVGPIGTKPSGIGAALFAASHPDVGIFYDHPKRSAKRTSAVARWHLFTIDF